jgi:hypothetical protein
MESECQHPRCRVGYCDAVEEVDSSFEKESELQREEEGRNLWEIRKCASQSDPTTFHWDWSIDVNASQKDDICILRLLLVIDDDMVNKVLDD